MDPDSVTTPTKDVDESIDGLRRSPRICATPQKHDGEDSIVGTGVASNKRKDLFTKNTTSTSIQKKKKNAPTDSGNDDGDEQPDDEEAVAYHILDEENYGSDTDELTLEQKQEIYLDKLREEKEFTHISDRLGKANSICWKAGYAKVITIKKDYLDNNKIIGMLTRGSVIIYLLMK
jgi:hypothetical protein